MAAGAVGGCSAFDALVRPPVSARGAAAYAHALNLSRRTAIRRRVYSCVLFGFELEMLRLHIRMRPEDARFRSADLFHLLG